MSAITSERDAAALQQAIISAENVTAGLQGQNSLGRRQFFH